MPTRTSAHNGGRATRCLPRCSGRALRECSMRHPLPGGADGAAFPACRSLPIRTRAFACAGAQKDGLAGTCRLRATMACAVCSARCSKLSRVSSNGGLCMAATLFSPAPAGTGAHSCTYLSACRHTPPRLHQCADPHTRADMRADSPAPRAPADATGRACLHGARAPCSLPSAPHERSTGSTGTRACMRARSRRGAPALRVRAARAARARQDRPPCFVCEALGHVVELVLQLADRAIAGHHRVFFFKWVFPVPEIGRPISGTGKTHLKKKTR